MRIAISKTCGEPGWRANLAEKSSLKYVNPNSSKVGQTHRVWSTVRNCLTDSKRAQLKCKLLTGTYILQGNRAAFNQYTVDSTCKLCSAASETRQHFIAECSAYEPDRGVYAEKLGNNPVLPDELKSDLLNPELFTQLIPDASFYINGRENLEALELHSREYHRYIEKEKQVLTVKLQIASNCQHFCLQISECCVKPVITQTVYFHLTSFKYELTELLHLMVVPR